MLTIEILRVLVFVIRFYTSNDQAIARELDQVIVNGQVNPNALRNLEDLIIQRQMHDVLELMRQTLRGNVDRLQEHRTILEQFHNECSDKTTEWPPWCYHFTQENNPVVQELNEKVKYQGNQNSDETTARSHGEQEDNSFRSTQVPPEEPEIPHPSGPFRNHAAVEPSQARHCCKCGGNIQDIATSCPPRITDVFKRLTPKQLHRFVAEVNKYDPNILGSIESQFFASPATADAFIITLLQHRHLSGRTCLLCLLQDVFESIGCGDLAVQIRDMYKKS